MNLELSFVLSGDLSEYKYTQKTILDLVSLMPESLNLIPKPLEVPVLSEKGFDLESRVNLSNKELNINFLPDKIEVTKFISNTQFNFKTEEKKFCETIELLYLNISKIDYFKHLKFERIGILSSISSDNKVKLEECVKEFRIEKDEKIEWLEKSLDRLYIDDLNEKINIIKSSSKQENQQGKPIEDVYPIIYKFSKDINTVPYISDERIDFNFLQNFIKALGDK